MSFVNSLGKGMSKESGPSSLWQFLIGFFAPFIPAIIGIYISTNYIDDFVISTNILIMSIFALPITCIGLLVYEYKKDRKAMMVGTGLTIFIVITTIAEYLPVFSS